MTSVKIYFHIITLCPDQFTKSKCTDLWQTNFGIQIPGKRQRQIFQHSMAFHHRHISLKAVVQLKHN